ncbi:MAG: peptidylprolyl isomerase [Spirochaetales bacterium]|nr:peptidylprolyl isomerase [Spirochaetales bacterium]
MKKWMCRIILFSLILGMGLIPGCERKSDTTVTGTDDKKAVPTRPPEDYKQWDAPPEMMIDLAKIYLATVKTEVGDIKFELMPAEAPVTVNNFIFLAGKGFYDGSSFHRVEEDVMAIGGKPFDGFYDGPGYTIPDEITTDIRFDEGGYVAMVKSSDPNTAGSQFFITLDQTPWLNGMYSIFGKVVEGLDVVKRLKIVDPSKDTHKGTGILSINISELEESLLPGKKPFVPKAPQLADSRPLAKLPIPAREFIYNTAPEMMIDPNKSYSARFVTTRGTIDAKLRPDINPVSVNNFVVLAKLGYWDNFPFTTVVRWRYAISGSPRAKPRSDIGYSIPWEDSPLLPLGIGKLGYWLHARMDGSSSGSNIFFMLTNDIRGHYGNVFGEVSQAGMKIVRSIPADDENKPKEKIIRVDIIED